MAPGIDGVGGGDSVVSIGPANWVPWPHSWAQPAEVAMSSSRRACPPPKTGVEHGTRNGKALLGGGRYIDDGFEDCVVVLGEHLGQEGRQVGQGHAVGDEGLDADAPASQ